MSFTIVPPRDKPELTLRAILTGIVVGALLTPCNVYSGLKIGWTFNMSVAAGLIGFSLWSLMSRIGGASPYGLLENNINQTTASSAASIISAGLAAPIPALALLTGQTLAYPVLVVWLIVVSCLGIVVAAGLRVQLLTRERLPFPAGIVTAETMQEIHGGSALAGARLRLLGMAAAVSAALKFAVTAFALGPLAPSWKSTISTPGGGTFQLTAANLGIALDPSALMLGFGAISGMRIGLSVLLGAALAWGGLAPLALHYGWAKAGSDADVTWFGPLVEWLLWPGATLMVTVSMTSLVVSLVRLARRRQKGSGESESTEASSSLGTPFQWAALLIVTIMCVAAQTMIFDIGWFVALLAVGMSYLLAIVAARVTGETSITPIGALGKITQLTFGAISPGQVSANLMTANVTGGAAGQCADLMQDLRTGQIIGATANLQIIAQVFGVLTGSFVAALAYLVLIPDPRAMLITPEWPAPAVATWKAVAEVMSVGLSAMPSGSIGAIAVAVAVGLALSLTEALSPERVRRYVPSGSAIGLAFVIPAFNSISLFLGALIAAIVGWLWPQWAEKRVVILASGLIVGESLAGVLDAMSSIVR